MSGEDVKNDDSELRKPPARSRDVGGALARGRPAGGRHATGRREGSGCPWQRT